MLVLCQDLLYNKSRVDRQACENMEASQVRLGCAMLMLQAAFNPSMCKHVPSTVHFTTFNSCIIKGLSFAKRQCLTNCFLTFYPNQNSVKRKAQDNRLKWSSENTLSALLISALLNLL